MPISTVNVASGSSSPRLARTQIKEAIDLINDLDSRFQAFAGHITGADPTGVADSTSAIQGAMDLMNLLFMGGTYGGGGGKLFLPPGRYKHTGLYARLGVSLCSSGSAMAVLMLMGASTTALKCTAADTALAADGVSFIMFDGLQFVSGETAPTAQVQWNAIGFSYTVFRNCDFEWFGGCSAVTMLGSTLASLGGPANWFNSFYDCNFQRLGYRPTGGVGLRVGDTAIGLEQITTWRFFGGRISGAGAGSGLQLRGTGCQFYSVVFEGCATAVDLGSASTRGATGNSFYGCYWEGNTSNRVIRANAENTKFDGSFVTGGTETDLSTSTQWSEAGYNVWNLPNVAGARWEVVIGNGAARRPTFSGPLAGFDLKDVAGSPNIATIWNAAASSSSWSYVQFLAGNLSTLMWEMGLAGLRPGTDNAMQMGTGALRIKDIFLVNAPTVSSDAREKTQQRKLNAAEKRVAKVLCTLMQLYKRIDEVEHKGDDALWHCGPMAQDVVKAFADEDLDAFTYGLVKKEADRLLLRYDQLFCWILAVS